MTYLLVIFLSTSTPGMGQSPTPAFHEFQSNARCETVGKAALTAWKEQQRNAIGWYKCQSLG